MEEPNFWDNPEEAQEQMKQLSSMKEDRDTYQKLVSAKEDMETLIEMGQEEDDDSVVPEIAEMMEEFKASFDAIRIKTLLSGEFDKDNAIIKLNAGAGGTEACDWCGMEIQSVAIASLSYDEASQKLIQMRNEGAMMSDPSIREGYVQGAMARSMEKAAANPNGAMNGFMGVQMGMNAFGSSFASASASNQQQMQQAAAKTQQEAAKGVWKCSCGTENTGNFCSNCGSAKPMVWICGKCGTENSGKFCSNCGSPKPEAAGKWVCACGTENTGKFCSNCGKPRQ